MSGIVEVLTQNILPIFIVAALGFLLQRSQALDVRTLSSVVFNVFTPCLVFSSLVGSRLPLADLAQLAAFSVIVVLAMGLFGLLAGRLLRLSRPDVVVLLLTIMFVNGGNFGLTLNQLRYGEPGLSRALVFFIVSTMLVYTVGVFLASMGNSDWRHALRRLLRVPAFYAVIVAVFVYTMQLEVPGPLMSAIDIGAAGAIPGMLIVLGMNIARLSSLSSLRLALPAASMRLVLGPLIALVTAGWLGMQGLNRSTSIIEFSMPTAVVTTVIATEFDVQPGEVTSIVVLSTLLSPITLAIYINLFSL
ncbi:MAG: AEC family transporter [Candidatus Promineifilaceae bacterium]|nr:AEC family transporter [Candidatus Promineifilaceae bacterium]